MHAFQRSALLSALLLAAPGLASASETVVGPPMNKADFQEVLDAASPGDEIVCLGGDYDFSGLGAVLITKGVEIVADDDGNPPIFHGLTDPMTGAYTLIPTNGGPSTNLTGNTAFAVPPGAVVEGLELDGLHFEGFERAITTLVGVDVTTGAALAEPGSISKLSIENCHVSNCFFGIALLGGPIEKFDIKDNVIDCSTGLIALNVQGDYVPFSPFPPNAYANTQRLLKGEIKGNVLHGGPTAAPPQAIPGQIPAINVAGVVKIRVKDNTIFAHPTSTGILVRDLKAFTFGPWGNPQSGFGDDGPIEMGQIKGNVIHNARYGILGQTATTIDKVELKSNTMVNCGLADVYLARTNANAGFQGSNGFVVKDNTFSGTATLADVFLDITTFGNEVTVPAGTVVVDMAPAGDNEIKFQ